MARNPGPRYFFETEEPVRRIAAALSGRSVALFLDFDGTLAPIVSSPEQAVMPEAVRTLLKRLSERLFVAVISGRQLTDIMQRVGIDGICYAGNHGAEIWTGREIVTGPQSGPDRERLREFLEKLTVALAPIPGVLIEDKGLTGSIHFRNVDAVHLDRLFDALDSITGAYTDTLRTVWGKRVVEVRPLRAWNKGDAVAWFLKHKGERMLPLALGDDATDADAFRAVRGRGVSICIGISRDADYYLKGQYEVARVLEQILMLLGVKAGRTRRG